MKKLLLLCMFLYSTVFGIAQEVASKYKEYSYTEFFELIEEETDSVFSLNDAVIIYSPETDKRFKSRYVEGDSLYNRKTEITIDKRIVLNNVHFLNNVFTAEGSTWQEGILKNIHFKKDVELNDVISFNAETCKFSGEFNYSLLECDLDGLDAFGRTYHSYRYCSFKTFRIFKNCERFTSGTRGYFLLRNNRFISSEGEVNFDIGLFGSESAQIYDNYIQSNGMVYISLYLIGGGVQFENNTIKSKYATFHLDNSPSSLYFNENKFSSFVRISVDELKSNDNVSWDQFRGKLLSLTSHSSFVRDEASMLFGNVDSVMRKELHKIYIDSVRYHNKNAFVGEIALKGAFHDYYKSRYDTESANEVYLELKDFETKRMEVRYEQNPSFKTYFTWKTNQFLKVFSAYGTEPARAIIFSLYVIVFFALIYLFFPNSWDKHGRNRFVDRYNFFFKYMRRKAGIHEVYLEDQKAELMSYDQFKENITSSEHHVPKFFTATALPLYRWSVSGTKLSAAFLKRIDIMKGSWNDLPKSKRFWKSILLIAAFLIAISYDLFIKMLNALMLSINTFTTLGFGEIPIKGLPRYLAIIQGFIGWFMLTIFSVSLISQLLN